MQPMILKNKWIILNLLILLIVLSYSINRDLHLEKQYSWDLRNRIVGARLQKDGKLPYFFHWKQADYPRYADPYNSQDSTLPACNITATPFFHDLLRPICEWPQRTISIFWMWLQYFLLILMIWMTTKLTPSFKQKLLLLNVGIFFTLTQGWIDLIREGQIYLIVTFLFCCFISALLYYKKSYGFLAGVYIALMILIRPIAIVLFIPFLFHYRKYKLFLITAFSCLGLYGLFVLSSHSEMLLWQNYQRVLKQHVRIHQDTNPAILNDFSIKPSVRMLEGIDFDEVEKEQKNHPIQEIGEVGSIFVIYRHITHHKIPLYLLNALNICSVVLLSSLFFYYGHRHELQVFQLALFSYILYETVELLGPIERYPYYSVQWLPVILISFLYSFNLNHGNRIRILLVIGFLLNIMTTSWIYDRRTLGEFVWFAALLLAVFPNTNSGRLMVDEKKGAAPLWSLLAKYFF
jgi:hypothetical protein